MKDGLSLHNGLIESVVARYEAETKGFGRALREIIRGEIDDSEDAALSLKRLGQNRVVPDAYRVDRARREVVCFEVADTHGVEAAMARYVEIGWLLDECGWAFGVVEFDISGLPRVIDWLAWHIALVRRQEGLPPLELRDPA